MSDKSMKSLTDGISTLSNLNSLTLNLNGVGGDNSKLSESGVEYMGMMMSKLTYLNSLDLNLSEWKE
jgi:hypothetical protein